MDGDYYISNAAVNLNLTTITVPFLLNTAQGASAALSLFSSPVSGSENFTGSISDIRVYNSVFTNAQVAALSQPDLPSYANAILTPSAPTWAATQYSWTCAPGFAGPTVLLNRSSVDGSWSTIGGTPSCTACAGSTYTLGGTVCAPCGAGATFVSASQSCVPAATQSGVPTNTALYVSGASSEGLGAFALANAGGVGSASDRLGNANAAVSLSLNSYAVSAPLSQLPTGGSARSMAAFVQCSPPQSATGRTIFDTWDGSPSPVTEHVMVLGRAAGAAPLVATAPYVVQQFVGGGATGNTAGNALGTGTSALFTTPSGIAIDSYDNLFVTDRKFSTATKPTFMDCSLPATHLTYPRAPQNPTQARTT